MYIYGPLQKHITHTVPPATELCRRNNFDHNVMCFASLETTIVIEKLLFSDKSATVQNCVQSKV